MDIELPGIGKLGSLADQQQRVSMLLWGDPGSGKTAWAASAPGNKLFINFDPDGLSTLGNRADVLPVDLSRERFGVVDKFNSDDPLSLSRVLSDDASGIDTVVVDSTTAYSQLAVEKGISVTKGATLERPSPGAYGARNAITLRMVTSLLRLSGKYNKHIIFTSHEDAPTTDDNGNVLYITMMLGGKLGNQAGLQISEIWHLSNTDKGRRVMIRPARTRKPMKTRMFPTDGAVEFNLKYDQFGPQAPYGEHSLAEIFSEWKEANYGKIPIPS